MINEHPFIKDIPAYTIGALDPDEVAVLEAHLATCEICRAELSAYRVVSDSLLLAACPQQPPAALRRRLQERISAAHTTVRPKFAGSFSQMAIGFAMILLLVLSTYSIVQTQQLYRQQAKLTQQAQISQVALAALAYPETKSIPLSGENITGTLLLAREQNVAVLIAWSLPILKSQQTYQIWLIDPQGKRTSGGIFNAQADLPYTTVPVISSGSLVNFVGIGVTVEPAGGSPQPTGPRIFKVDF
jgi:anti-sigma-K factor RskA